MKSMMFCASTFLNKSLIEKATKCLLRTSLKSTHSIRMCFTFSGRCQVQHSGIFFIFYTWTYRPQLMVTLSIGLVGVRKMMELLDGKYWWRVYLFWHIIANLWCSTQRHDVTTMQYKYRNGLLPTQYVFLIRSRAGCKKYVTRLRLVTYFL